MIHQLAPNLPWKAVHMVALLSLISCYGHDCQWIRLQDGD